jgi:hypothetical protein
MGGAIQLPRLNDVAMTVAVFHSKPGISEIARAMVTAGAARRGDWDADRPGPGPLIERIMERSIRHMNRGQSELIPLYAFLRRWEEYVDEVFSESTEGDERWVLGLESYDTHRIRVRPLIDALGELTAGAVLAHLTDLTPVCIEGPEDLEWIIDGWHDNGADEENEEASAIRQRAEEATELTERIGDMLARGRAVAIKKLKDPRLRRLLQLLKGLSRRTPPGDDRAWQETAGVDWELPRPVIHLIWDEGCPISHALDEAENLRMQDGSHPMPQDMWLLDPGDAKDAALTWSRWTHLLRRARATALLIEVLDEFTSCSP